MDATEDKEYWNKMYQQNLSEAELLEIRANLVRFVKILVAQNVRVNNTAVEARPQ